MLTKTLKAFSHQDAILLAIEGSPQGALSFSLREVKESDRISEYEVYYFSNRKGLYKL